MLLHVRLLHLVASLAREDDEFADDVGTAQVDTRIGFAIAFFLCAPYRLRERHFGRECIEDVVECSRENGLNLQNLVAGVTKVVDGSDNRQTSTDIRLEAEFYTSLHCCLLQEQVVAII